MMADLLLDDVAQIRTLTINRPERRNALTPELMDGLAAAMESAEQDGMRLIVLRGAGEAFSAGLDLSALQQMATLTAEQHLTEAHRVGRMFRALWDCNVPTMAVVQGPAIAGGTGLATMCDFTLAAPEATFGYTEVRIGFVPALVSAYLALQVGDKFARDLTLSARIFDAKEAHRLGLVTEVVERERLEMRAHELAQQLLKNSPEGLRATKQLLRAQNAAWLDHALAMSMEANAASRQTADFHEGIASFLEKRKPVWK